MSAQNFIHISVLSQQLLSSLHLAPGDIVVDCTGGGGGHSKMLLPFIQPKGKLICLDRDPIAIAHLSQLFATEIQEGKLLLMNEKFSNLSQICHNLGIHQKISAIVADLGISSPQVDESERGFSFLRNGPLDMRMDKNSPFSAADFIREATFEEMIKVFREYGEEPSAPIVAKAIIKERAKKEFLTTHDLANLISAVLPWRKAQKSHPATRIFQALRIHINQELDELKNLLPTAFAALKPEGRLAVISFHSLEDRIIKDYYNSLAKTQAIDPLIGRHLPLTSSELDAMHRNPGKLIKPFPMKPDILELAENHRSRSAKLRVIEKIF